MLGRPCLVSWRVAFTKQAQRDAKYIARAGLKAKAQSLITVLTEDPYKSTPPFEKLRGDLQGLYSRRINIQHRLAYAILDGEKTVKVLRM